MREQVLKEWINCKEKLSAKIATLNTKIDELSKKNEKQLANLYKQGSKLGELKEVKNFLDLLFNPQNEPLILTKKQSLGNYSWNSQSLRHCLGNYYQFGVLATWKVENNQLVLKSVLNGQALEHTLEKITANPYYLGKLALTENENK